MSLTPRLDKIQKNYLINADMRIAQRGTSFAAIGSGVYSLDRWRYDKSGAMVHTVSQDTNVPTLLQADYLFQNSLLATLTTPDTSIAAGDHCEISQRIEGYNWVNLANKPFTLSFWVKATLTGIYCVAFLNSNGDRSYIAEYTINATNTWEYKTITVSASPSAGTWNYTNGVGLDVRWTLAAGTTFQTTANAWQSGSFLATANQVNGVNTGATDFRLTGVCLYEGELSSPEFSTFGKDLNAEISAAKRYYQKTYEFATAPGTNVLASAFSGAADGTSSHHFGTRNFVPEMRTTPSITQYRPSGGAPSATPFTDGDGVSNPFGASFYNVSHRGFSMHINGASGAGATKYAHFTFDAEL